MSRILVITTSLRAGSNSDILAERLIAGAKDAGHEVEHISLKGREIKFCVGCLTCQKTQACVLKDDAVGIAEKVKHADTLVFATPIYYYEMSGQMKTLLDRLNPLFPSDYRFRRVYKYLAEMNIYKENGGNFPNTTINRIIKNELYTGVVHNGEAKSEVIPELQIIDRDTYERAQRIMQGRSQHHSDIPLNLKGGALLVGRIFCGHCGNRLTLTTSGRKTVHKDGSVTHELRPRYACHFKPRHPGECDGQSGYGVKKLDGIVDQIVREQLQRIKTSPNTNLALEQHQKTIDLAEVRLKMAKTQQAEKRREIADYQAETIRVIRGESKLSKDLLTTLLEKASEEEKELSLAVEEAQHTLDELIQDDANRETVEYDRLLSWADFYDTCSFETKKMFISQFIKSVRVSRDYNIEIEFNVSFDEFKNLKASGEMSA